MGDGWLTDPAQGQARQRDAELCGRDVAVQLVYRAMRRSRAVAACFSKLRDARSARANECKFRGDEKGIHEDQ